MPVHARFPLPSKVLALDTSTDRLSVALGAIEAGQMQVVQTHEGPGGAQASATMIPVILSLLAAQGWTLAELDGIAFGCGPGSFTGLRTTCAVVQGLAVAARPGGIPVLPVNTLLAVAEEARWQNAQGPMTAAPERIVAVLDARMDELYVAEVQLTAAGPRLLGAPWLSAPEALRLGDGWPDAVAPHTPAPWLAGNAMAVYGARLPVAWQTVVQRPAWPTANAMLRLLPGLWADGLALDAAGAQPLYVRDKVA
ncbi:MAG TPA: tRNA (adenosine(37)-N6)-threonylcarbamoyltransferase complex dimerization subunit type 1 TsaB, partial [Burkholderiaceae bacterium]|nr:tRNA (adenosine(37)-N6)-threonylcarbamoyltransferase complex dimerization subunit type 1 TsaB [Burkholderiaceae bacterium]